MLIEEKLATVDWRHDLPTLVYGRVISPIREVLISTNIRICEFLRK